MLGFQTVGGRGTEWLVVRGPGIELGHWHELRKAVQIGAEHPTAPIPPNAWDPAAKAGLVFVGPEPDAWVDRDVVTAALADMSERFAKTERESMAEKARAALAELNGGAVILVKPAWLVARVRRRLSVGRYRVVS
jgi:hypothetical protein